ncbi:MAG: hypothetical protein ACLTDR_05775 [Adlercreutzia equolifaciens]
MAIASSVTSGRVFCLQQLHRRSMFVFGVLTTFVEWDSHPHHHGEEDPLHVHLPLLHAHLHTQSRSSLLVKKAA